MRGVLVPLILPVVTLVREHAFPNADAGASVHAFTAPCREQDGADRQFPRLSSGRPQARLRGAVRGWVFEGDLVQYGDPTLDVRFHRVHAARERPAGALKAAEPARAQPGERGAPAA